MALTTLLLPGMHGTSRLFDRLVVEMPDTIEPRVVTYPTDEVLGYAQLLARIELPAGPFAIVAESYSGPLAIRIAAARSANVCGLVLVASFARSPRPAIPRWAARLVGSWRPAVSAARIRDVHCVDVRGDFRRIAAPILYLRGSRDRVVPPRVADELKSLRPDMELVTLDAPHAVLQRRPVESATAIARFLLEKSRSGPASTCAAWRDVIVAKVEAGLSAERIHQDLGAEHGFTGSYWSVRRFVRRLKETRELPVRRIETAAGEEAQVDFEMGIFESRRRSEESGSRDNEDRVFQAWLGRSMIARQAKSPGDRWSPGPERPRRAVGLAIPCRVAPAEPDSVSPSTAIIHPQRPSADRAPENRPNAPTGSEASNPPRETCKSVHKRVTNRSLQSSRNTETTGIETNVHMPILTRPLLA